MKKVVIIGAGVSGLASACYLAKAGFKVTVVEKNEHIGGRARHYSKEGFMFDMGPSWYWMPDIFDRFFIDFGKDVVKELDLVQLDPGFKVVFGKDDELLVPALFQKLIAEFESKEKGSEKQLVKFIEEAKLKYEIAMKDLIYKPSLGLREFLTFEVLSGLIKTSSFSSIKKHVAKHFSDKRLQAIMEFPVLFLGAMPNQIPALYSLMNYSALVQGTFYPMGGMKRIIDSMEKVAKEFNIEILTGKAVDKIIVESNIVKGVKLKDVIIYADAVVASADYAHVEKDLIDKENANYTENYWDKKTFAPSSLIFYLGVNKKIKKLEHHNLFFDADLEVHAKEIYESKEWPSNPLFYVCCPSRTDKSVAPKDCENLFILMPLAIGIEDNETTREKYYNIIMKRLSNYCGEDIENAVIVKDSYCISNFVKDYNAYKGNAYGLANTLSQTAFLKPKMKNNRVKNLFYTGQLTVPGPGLPPALISGKIVSELVTSKFKKQ